MEQIWKQHTEEMQVLEGNILNVCGEQCTLEFQPSADQSWQSWANNELSQAATYPSPYTNVSKHNMCIMGGSIGIDEQSTWQATDEEKRKQDLGKLEKHRKKLSSQLSPSQRHNSELEFMATNGLRQFGEARIGVFANRQRPEPVHNEINSWQHFLNLIYKEALQRNTVSTFLEILGSPIDQVQEVIVKQSPNLLSSSHQEGVGERVRKMEIANEKAKTFKDNLQQTPQENTVRKKPGCGLPFVANKLKEHYDDVEHRYNKLSTRLIGEQAIALAKYSYRLIVKINVLLELI